MNRQLFSPPSATVCNSISAYASIFTGPRLGGGTDPFMAEEYRHVFGANSTVQADSRYLPISPPTFSSVPYDSSFARPMFNSITELRHMRQAAAIASSTSASVALGSQNVPRSDIAYKEPSSFSTATPSIPITTRRSRPLMTESMPLVGSTTPTLSIGSMDSSATAGIQPAALVSAHFSKSAGHGAFADLASSGASDEYAEDKVVVKLPGRRSSAVIIQSSTSLGSSFEQSLKPPPTPPHQPLPNIAPQSSDAGDYKLVLYKTRLCPRWYAPDVVYCRHGSSCRHAHGPSEIGTPFTAKYNKVCLAWKNGECKLGGERCYYRHGWVNGGMS